MLSGDCVSDGPGHLFPALVAGEVILGAPPPPQATGDTWGSTCLGSNRGQAEAGCPAGTRSVHLCHGQVYIEDSLGERIWVDSPHCKTFVDNIQTAFNTKMPPKSMLLQGEVGRSGGDLSAGKRCWVAGLGRGQTLCGRGSHHLPPWSPLLVGVGGHRTVGGCVHEWLGLQGAVLTLPSRRRRTARQSS